MTLEYAEPLKRDVGGLVGRVSLGIFLLTGYWVAWVIGCVSPFIAMVVLALGVREVVRRRWAFVWIAVVGAVISPMGLGVGSAMAGYFDGTATWGGRGPMRGQRLDRATRVPVTPGGCIMLGNEWMVETPYGLTLLGLLKLIGPMRGTYDGPFPEEAAAYGAVVGAGEFDLKELSTDRMTVGGMTVRLRAGLGDEILRVFAEGPAANLGDAEVLKEYGPARVTVVGGRCVVLAIPGQMPEPGRENRTVFLIDGRSGKVVAVYGAVRRSFWSVWR